jgi:hypothetical protein
MRYERWVVFSLGDAFVLSFAPDMYSDIAQQLTTLEVNGSTCEEEWSAREVGQHHQNMTKSLTLKPNHFFSTSTVSAKADSCVSKLLD